MTSHDQRGRRIIIRTALYLSLTALFIACGQESTPATERSACNSTEDCPSSEPYCDPFQGCVACQIDSDCGEGFDCGEDRRCHKLTVCESDDDCKDPEKPACDGVCVGCTETQRHCGTHEVCEDNSCVSYTPCINSLDCPDGAVCDKETRTCVQCLTDADCGAGGVCAYQKCEKGCDSDTDCRDDGKLCSPSDAYCVQCVDHRDCPDIYHCERGSCELDVCRSGDSECNLAGDAIRYCGTAGADFDYTFCRSDGTCVEELGQAQCAPVICFPGDVGCAEDLSEVIQCSENGVVFYTVERCASGETCDNAKCVPTICEPGDLRCKGTALEECTASGATWRAKLTCGPNQYCDEKGAKCSANVCKANTPSCVGNTAGTCNENGSALLSPHSCGDAELCEDGACAPIICTPDTLFCANNQVRRCSSTGTSSSLDRDCATAFASPSVCMEDSFTPGYAACIPQICDPGTPVCSNGGTAATCDATGTGYTNSLRCSDSGQACFDGACAPRVCTPAELYCSGQEIRICGGYGEEGQPYYTCPESEHCYDPNFASPYCRTDRCTAGEPMCNSTTATVCASDGSGPAAGGTNCSLTNLRCVAGSCVP